MCRLIKLHSEIHRMPVSLIRNMTFPLKLNIAGITGEVEVFIVQIIRVSILIPYFVLCKWCMILLTSS